MFRKRALIIVDMLNDFINENGALYCGPQAQEIVKHIQERLMEYRHAQRPIIYLADAHSKHDIEFERFPEHCVAGTWGAQIINELKSTAKENIPPPKINGANESIIRKTRYSGFYGTSLDIVLNPHFHLAPRVSEIEVCGVCTSICVMDTVGGLANRDYSTVVRRNCVADFDQEMHEMALKRMGSLYGTTIVQ